MSFLASLFGAGPAKIPGPDDDYWYTKIGAEVAAGVPVTPETALRVSAVYGCVKVISETVASLPPIVYRRRRDGGKERVPDHRVQRLINRPNRHQTRFEFFEQYVAHFALRGNGLAEWGIVGTREELHVRHPDRVKPLRLAGGDVAYELREGDGKTRTVPAEMMLHVRNLSHDGLWGLSPIEQAAESIGISLAADRFSGKFFSSAARPSGVLKHPGKLGGPAAKNLRQSWQLAHGGGNVGGVAVLEEGMSFEKLTLTPDEAQFIETMQYRVEDIARFWRMPLHKIGHLLRATFSNIEHQGIEFSTDTIAPVCARVEQALTRTLFTEEEQEEFFVEYLLDALLRGDTMSRHTAWQSALTAGWMTRNEVRMRENLNPLDGLDEPLAPLNMGKDEPAGGAPPAEEPEQPPEPDEDEGEEQP